MAFYADVEGPYFANYGEPPHTPNNLTPSLDWPPNSDDDTDTEDPGIQPTSPEVTDAVSATGSRSTQFLLPGKGARSFVTSAHQLSMRHDKDKKSIVTLFANTSGPGTEVSCVSQH